MDFRTDILGEPYQAVDLPLTPDDEGEVMATLVRRRAQPAGTRRAVLYVHGYTDYFFQTHLADFYVDRGFDFYALDLRKYGRSLRPHHSPNFVRDLDTYAEELDEAVRIIRDVDGHDTLLVNGHSTGGLVSALYADRRVGRGTIDGLFLNSPFLSMPASYAVRTLGAPLLDVLGRFAATRKLPTPLNPHYVHSLHRDFRGSWDFDLKLKPAEGFPLYPGWLAAIQQGQRRVRRGLRVDCPVLVMASTASTTTLKWDDALHHTDGVLRADDIAALAPRLGRHVATVRIKGGVHDLVLSGTEAREQFFAELDRWLTTYL
ncbi:alpha/beta hydrolase [Streptantibioticus rubrisoli]|uniref:Alpha/beta hydrolase n=1 Tax=Streptantibioticus rubrisoli TaxID=1387313 RepID=A0ABT1PB20_9ACTN|nr:alpha/beta hydrolase [Streptantibioticus rubrisoli]MCQ4042563.1 alpha/beta hydrolase [Streptantibioticus rubrisoli]